MSKNKQKQILRVLIIPMVILVVVLLITGIYTRRFQYQHIIQNPTEGEIISFQKPCDLGKECILRIYVKHATQISRRKEIVYNYGENVYPEGVKCSNKIDLSILKLGDFVRVFGEYEGFAHISLCSKSDVSNFYLYKIDKLE